MIRWLLVVSVLGLVACGGEKKSEASAEAESEPSGGSATGSACIACQSGYCIEVTEDLVVQSWADSEGLSGGWVQVIKQEIDIKDGYRCVPEEGVMPNKDLLCITFDELEFSTSLRAELNAVSPGLADGVLEAPVCVSKSDYDKRMYCEMMATAEGCFVCLEEDPYAFRCPADELTERTDGTKVCVRGTDLVECGPFSNCCN